MLVYYNIHIDRRSRVKVANGVIWARYEIRNTYKQTIYILYWKTAWYKIKYYVGAKRGVTRKPLKPSEPLSEVEWRFKIRCIIQFCLRIWQFEKYSDNKWKCVNNELVKILQCAWLELKRYQVFKKQVKLA